MKIRCTTTFDITATGTTGHVKPTRMPFTDRAGTKITSVESWNRSRNQQRNWETMTQLISLRTQISELKDAVRIDNVWQFEFTVENENLFLHNDDPLSILKSDCDQVPMLTGLSENTATDSMLIVDKNIWFTIVPINSL